MTLFAIIFAAAEAATGSASAQGLDLKGMNFIDGDTIKTIFAFLGMAITGLFTYLKMKSIQDSKIKEAVQQTKTSISNDPLHVQNQGPYVTVGECKQHRCALEKRIDEIGPALNRIFTKLTDIDRRSEERAVKLHERIGPIAERVAADNAKIDTIGKVVDAALARSTVGGKK